MTYACWVEIDLDALAANIALLRAIVGETHRILMVVKADAYGHGAVEVSRQAERCGVDFLGVGTLHEGIEVRRAGVRLPVLLLNPILPGEAAAVVEHDLRASVSSHEIARALAEAGRRRGKKPVIHLEVDTGMGRAGLPAAETLELVKQLSRLEGLSVEGVFTHFPSAEGEDQSFTAEQMARFMAFVADLRQLYLNVPMAHAANSGAILGAPETWLDMVRPGLLLYGLAPQRDLPGTRRFRPVMSFKTRIVHLRWMPPGGTVSYGRTYEARQNTLVATIGAGYGHGLPWKLSSRGQVLVRGQRVPILGRVTMDLTMLDVTNVDGVQIGDEVVLFGTQGEQTIGAHDVAEWAGTIVYEVICGIGKRVVRRYTRDGKASKALTLVGEETL